MKLKNILQYLPLFLFFHITFVQSEGFLSHPLIKAFCQYSHIKKLNPVIIHNTVPVVVIYIPAIVSTLAPVIETCAAVGATLLGIHLTRKAHKLHANDVNSDSSPNYSSYYPNPNDPHDDENKKKINDHPHGIYKDAPYHHKNTRGNKSPAPKNGQELLDKAFPIEGSQDSFINLDGDNNFVVFYKTIGREFHGHIRTWNE